MISYEEQVFSAGTPSACTRAGSLFQVRRCYHESVRVCIDVYRAHLFEKRTADNKLETIHLKYVVVISRLIQSQHQLKAPSTRPAEHPDRRYILSFEILLEFFNSIPSHFNHMDLLFQIPFNAGSQHQS